MNQPIKIGITGGIGSGKTHVAEVFAKLGVPVYFADERAKWLMNNNKNIIKKVVQLFGANAYENKHLNRTLIASSVFKNKALLSKLNSIVHPEVYHDFEVWANAQNAPYVLKEAALLFESGSYKELDAILTIDAPLETRIRRASKRDKQSRKKIESRIKNQLPNEIKLDASDFVINNDGCTPILPQILLLHMLWSK